MLGATVVCEVGDWWGEAERWRLLSLQRPEVAAYRNNRANALWLHDDPLGALPEAEQALQLDPRHPVAWRCLGNILQDLGRFETALAAYRQSLDLDQDAATAFTCSKALMGLGRLEEAYALAEQRLQIPEFRSGQQARPWQGWPDAKHIWLTDEQGFGDVIQHLRWVVPLLQAGHAVTLELKAPLVALAAQGLAWAGGELQVQPRPQELNRHATDSCQGSLLSLPHRLGDAPLAGVCPYLRLPPGDGPDQGSLGRRPRIGLIWASGRYLDRQLLERDYRRKSFSGAPLQSLLNALAQRPVELVSLQFGPDREPPPWIGTFAAVLPIDADFLAAAQWMLGLDLIISVDTASAHLAGALGCPVWTLLPWAAEGRWQRERRDTPWYPSMRLLRQPRHGDWYGLIQLLIAHLDLWLCDRPRSGISPAAD